MILAPPSRSPAAAPLIPSATTRPMKIQPIGFDGKREAISAPTTPETKKIAIAIASFEKKCQVSGLSPRQLRVRCP